MNERDFPLEEKANGVMYKGKFYPYSTMVVVPTAVSTSITPKPNTRFFIPRAKARYRTVAGDTTTNMFFQMVVHGETIHPLVVHLIPSVAATFVQDFPIGILGDKGTPIIAAVDVAPTVCAFNITFAEVDD